MSQYLALNSNWLNSTPTYATNAAASNALSNCVSGWYHRDYWYPYYYPITITQEVEHKPIRLTLSEVERLRAIAKKDKEVKAILAKFTDQIEITVDF